MLPLLHAEIATCFSKSGQEDVCVAFIGVAGRGSEGNHHGQQMRGVVKQIVEREQIHSLIIDLRQLEYEFGDWIGSCFLHSRLQTCSTSLVANGMTWDCLRPIWEMSHLELLVPVFQTLEEAKEFVGRMPSFAGTPATDGAR